MNSKPVKVLFCEEAEIVYQSFYKLSISSKTARMLLSAIDQKVSFLKSNFRYGDSIAKKLIPKEYIIKHNTINLFRIELPLFWRMLYTVTHDENSIIVFILDILNHKAYDKKFGYKGH